MSEIEIINLSKSFGDRKVLNQINLSIEKGDIYGILGLSGAGKSTLVRCINGLETFSEGEIRYKGELLCSPDKKISHEAQRKIAMIFQSFNLLQQRSVIANVRLPLELDRGFMKAKREKLKEEWMEKQKTVLPENRKELDRTYKHRIRHLEDEIALDALRKVGLEDKKDSYPSMLSGGQCQRVAIARALVLEPEVILSDESTSALDPETTNSILDLLSSLSKSMGLTVIMISHQMNAIEHICNKVAIIDKAQIVEQGNLSDVFLFPKADITKSLLYANHINTDLSENEFIRILFDGNTDEPLVSNIVQDCQIAVSIVYADTKVADGKVYGQTLIKRPANPDQAERLLRYLSVKQVSYEEVSK